MHFQLLFGELGGFGYDTCAAFGNYGENGVTPLGCDEFFPPPQVYKDLRSHVSVQRARGIVETTLPAYSDGSGSSCMRAEKHLFP